MERPGRLLSAAIGIAAGAASLAVAELIESAL
jgi:hypothetical protein